VHPKVLLKMIPANLASDEEVVSLSRDFIIARVDRSTVHVRTMKEVASENNNAEGVHSS
jgi:hypothetical protein